jgi:capsular exopolysaccharide synthesis family protein
LLTSKVDDLQQQIDAIDQQVGAATPDQRDALRRSLADQRQVLVDQRAVAQQRLDQLEVDASSQSGGARITSAAITADQPVGPSVLRIALLALGTGLLLGFALALVADFLDDAVHTADDLARASGGLTVLSSVPSFQQPDFRPLALTKPTDPAVEAYRTLRTELQFATKHMPYRVLQVTSPSAGEGTSTTAVNLAVLVALTGRRVALVDANLREPGLHLSFRADGRKGLTAALLGEPLIDLLHPVALSSGHLEVLPAGFVPSNPSETLGARRMRAVIEELASTFDLVVIDSAPVLRLADSVVLMGLADAVVLVTEADRTSISDVRETMSVLSRASAPLVGTVLNRASS